MHRVHGQCYTGQVLGVPLQVLRLGAILLPAGDRRRVGLLHPNESPTTSFRQLVASSHQFNAVSRSSRLLGADPDAEERRVLVRGKGNHSAAPKSFEFAIAAEAVELNGQTFEVPKVVD